jgi:hypothetical protein
VRLSTCGRSVIWIRRSRRSSSSGPARPGRGSGSLPAPSLSIAGLSVGLGLARCRRGSEQDGQVVSNPFEGPLSRGPLPGGCPTRSTCSRATSVRARGESDGDPRGPDEPARRCSNSSTQAWQFEEGSLLTRSGHCAPLCSTREWRTPKRQRTSRTSELSRGAARPGDVHGLTLFLGLRQASVIGAASWDEGRREGSSRIRVALLGWQKRPRRDSEGSGSRHARGQHRHFYA